METYEEKIKNNKKIPKIITIRVVNKELISFLEDLKTRGVKISELTRQLWKDSPDFHAWRDRDRPFVSEEEFERMKNDDC